MALPEKQPATAPAATPESLEGLPSTRQEEWRSFLFLTVVMAPMLAIMLVGGYGFAIWMYQLFTGELPHG